MGARDESLAAAVSGSTLGPRGREVAVERRRRFVPAEVEVARVWVGWAGS